MGSPESNKTHQQPRAESREDLISQWKPRRSGAQEEDNRACRPDTHKNTQRGVPTISEKVDRQAQSLNDAHRDWLLRRDSDPAAVKQAPASHPSRFGSMGLGWVIHQIESAAAAELARGIQGKGGGPARGLRKGCDHSAKVISKPQRINGAAGGWLQSVRKRRMKKPRREAGLSLVHQSRHN